MAARPAEAASCTIAAQGVNFGSYDPFAAADLEGIGNIQLSCDVATSVEVSLSAGGGSFPARTMMAGGQGELTYNLYTDTLRTNVWGDGTSGSATVSVNATAADLTVYGSARARQNVQPGSYTDIIIVTITY